MQELDKQEETLLVVGYKIDNLEKSDLTKFEEELDETEKTGDKIKDDLAKVVTGRFTKKLSRDMVNKKFDDQLRPMNCDVLVVPKVNNEVWQSLPLKAKKSDLSLSKIQRAL